MSELRIISAMYPAKFADDCAIYMKVWFEGYNGPVDYVADPFDVSPHGRELWFRAMMGEYGEVRVFNFLRPQDFGFLPSQKPPIPPSMKNQSLLQCLYDIKIGRDQSAIAAQVARTLPAPEVKNDG